MKKFCLKTILFLLPIFLCFWLTDFLYTQKTGDLLRIGYLPNLFPKYRNQFEEDYRRPIVYQKFCQTENLKEFEILTIGDSFSEQNSYGYQNYARSRRKEKFCTWKIFYMTTTFNF